MADQLSQSDIQGDAGRGGFAAEFAALGGWYQELCDVLNRLFAEDGYAPQ
jgi:hypothetical protein